MYPVFVKSILVLAALVLLLPQQAAAVTVEDFHGDIAAKAFEFQQGKNQKRVISGDDMASQTNIYEAGEIGKNRTVVVEFEEAGDGYLALFRTRDPGIVFLGDVKVGWTLDSVKDKIPGTMSNFTEGDRQGYKWDMGESLNFTVYLGGDVISELVFHNPLIMTPERAGKAYVDVATIK
jgi:hypothetical protein